jgi:RNA polymerase sigma-70 factor (ECF subfamily)
MVMAREEWVLLERAIEGLPPGCRRVLMLRMVERLSHGEIAERLNLARSSVEKHLMRAIRLLGDALRASQAGRGPKIVSLESRTGTDRSSP